MSERKGSNWMIVLGAGMGKRMNAAMPKMMLPLCQRPLLYWSLKNLESCPAIDFILLTAPAPHQSLFERKIKEWRFKKVVAVVSGGKERQDSTLSALRSLPSSAEWIGIHDAARIFVSSQHVQECFDSARKLGAAILAVPSKDTIKLATLKKIVKKTPPRQECWCAQTPQVFHRSILRKMEKILSHRNSSKWLYTDEASIAEKLGAKVCLVPSSYENIKITTPEDLILAEAILKKKSIGFL